MQKFPELFTSSASLSAPYLKQLLQASTVSQEDCAIALPEVLIDSARLMGDHHYRVPIYKVCQLLDSLLAKKSLSQSEILEAVFRLRVKSFPLLGYAVMASVNLGQAIQNLKKFEDLIWNLGTIRLHLGEEWAQLSWHSELPVPPLLVEIAVAGWVNIGRQLLPAPHEALTVNFSHEGDEQLASACFNCPVQYGSAFSGVEIPNLWLERALPDSDTLLEELVLDQASVHMAHFQQTTNLENEVRTRQLKSLPNPLPDLEHVAEEIGFSPRQLRYQLSEQGLNYRNIQDEARKDAACFLLQHSPLTLTEIAQYTDFAEQSGLNRAFQRWFGCSPLQWRLQNQASISTAPEYSAAIKSD